MTALRSETKAIVRKDADISSSSHPLFAEQLEGPAYGPLMALPDSVENVDSASQATGSARYMCQSDLRLR
jgi:hypothetical protein